MTLSETDQHKEASSAKKRRFLLLGVVFVLALGFALVGIRNFQKPIPLKDVPEWKIKVLNPREWEIFAVREPNRRTQVFLEMNPNGLKCDTIVLMGGVGRRAEPIKWGKAY